MCSEFQKFSNNGNDIEAKKLFDQLLELHHVMFVESNPVPAKYSLSLLKLMEEDVRLPLVTATEDSKNKIRNILKKTSII